MLEGRHYPLEDWSDTEDADDLTGLELRVPGSLPNDLDAASSHSSESTLHRPGRRHSPQRRRQSSQFFERALHALGEFEFDRRNFANIANRAQENVDTVRPAPHRIA